MRLPIRSEEHTSELQSHDNLVCRLLLEKKAHDAADLPPSHRCPPTHTRPPSCRQGVSAAANAAPDPAVGSPTRCSGGLLIFFNDTATTEIYTLSLHDALPI